MTTSSAPTPLRSSNVIDILEGATEFVYVPFRAADDSGQVLQDLADGETLSSATVTQPATLSITGEAVGSTAKTWQGRTLAANCYVRMTVAAGTSPVANTIYEITVLATTSEGRTIGRIVRVRIIADPN